jgi:hypothetical protein
MSAAKAVSLLTLPAKLAVSDPRVTGALLLALIYYPEKLQSLLPPKVYSVVASPRFIQALKVFLGFGVLKSVNNKLSQYVVNNWMRDAKFVKSQEIVLITGGSSGLGLGMAQEFSKLGAKVVVTDVNPPKTALRK